MRLPIKNFQYFQPFSLCTLHIGLQLPYDA